MLEFTTIPQIKKWVAAQKRLGKSIGFVPTMGALHRGHLSLIESCADKCDVSVVSIYVNPTQFNNQTDFAGYPNTIDADRRASMDAGVTVLFCPADSEMYPDSFQTEVSLSVVSEGACGKDRPGHFTGMATIVAKLINIVQPDAMWMGLKDLQQYHIVRQMVQDLNISAEVVAGNIIRATDGLALSSRNQRLSPGGRTRALSIYTSLKAVNELFCTGTRDAKTLIEAFQDNLLEEITCIYAEIRCLREFSICCGQLEEPSAILVAVEIEGVRLIDNWILEANPS